VLQWQIWSFYPYVKWLVHNYGDSPKKFDPLHTTTFQGHSRSLEPTQIGQPSTYDLLLMFRSNCGPISYCFWEWRAIFAQFSQPSCI